MVPKPHSSALSGQDRLPPGEVANIAAPERHLRERSIWELYNESAERIDHKRADDWNALADAMLLFAALFGSFLSAFLTVIMGNLEPDNGELTVELLVYISSQLNNVSMPAYTPQPFAVELPYVVANGLFFASLAVLLVTSLLAILVKDWIRDFNQSLPPQKLIAKRAEVREYRFRGLIAYKMPEIVASLPLLIQFALLLFCAGLLVYLNQANVHIMITTGCIFASGFGFYLLTTIISLYDPSAPFPTPLSRFLSHMIRWISRFPSRTIRWFEHRRSTRTNHSFGISIASLPRNLLGVLRRALASSRNSRKSSDLELHVMNRLANETLVALENARVFTPLVQSLAAHSRLRPIARQEWRDIVSTVLIVESSTPLLTIRGILRVIVIAYDPTVEGGDALLNLASALLKIDKGREHEPGPIPLSIDTQKQESVGQTPFSQHFIPSNTIEPRGGPYTITAAKAAAGASERENREKLELENTSLVPLSPLQPFVQRLKHIVLSIQDWSTGIENKVNFEEITLELLWLADFFQSRLCYTLDEELRSKLLESGIQSTQDVLVLASWLPTELGLPLVSAGINVGLALNTSKQRKGGKEQYFGVVHRPSTDPEAMCSDLVSLLDHSGHGSALCVPVLLALWHLDPPSSLLSVHKRKGKLDSIAKLVGVEPIALDHFSILNFTINSIPRKSIQGTFMAFMECWDQLAKDPVVPLKKEHLEFFEMTLKRLEPLEGGSDDPPLAAEDRNAVMTRSATVQNPWIILAGDPIRQAAAVIPDVQRAVELMEQTPWVGDERYERIVRDNLDSYCNDTLQEPYLPIMVLFEQSTELRSYLQALCLSSHKHGGATEPEAEGIFTETRVARFTKIASRIFKEEKNPPEMLENYLVMQTELLTYFGLLIPEIQRMIATVFQQHGGLQWLSDACKLLAIDVQKRGLVDSQGRLVETPSAQPEQNRLCMVVSYTYGFLEALIPQFTSPLTSSDVSALRALLSLPGYIGIPKQRKNSEALAKKVPGWSLNG